MRTSKLPLSLAFAAFLPASVVYAAPPEDGADEDAAETDEGGEAGASAGASGSVSLGGGGGKAEGSASAEDREKEYWKRKDMPWIKRWAPEKGMAELGIYGGVFFAAKNHELFEPDRDLPDQGFKPFRLVNPDIGLRAAYYPARFLGVEVEGGVIPFGLDDGSGTAIGYAVRGHLIAQLARWSVTPFILLGAGGLGVSSDRSLVGKDIDPALHFGAGLKIFINRYTMLRLDVRDNVTYQRGLDNNFKELANVELLLGLSVTLGREKREVPPEEPAPEEPPPSDRDGDGFLDEVDLCPDEPGVEPDGCPVGDRDGDGILDPDDQCPDEPGVPEYAGCPIPDTDGDGILDDTDACVEEPETVNDYEDEDGCPDEVPDEIKKFTGVIEGIYFDTNKDTIRPQSEKVLKRALKVLQDYPNIRLSISGHTDSRGSRELNLDLSKRRADAVKTWLVEQGIDDARLETDGFGPDQPIDSNESKAGRAKNRRIEFKLLR